MKRNTILMFLIISIFACTSKKENHKELLKEKSEKIILANLNDPSSYEFVSFEIDTNKRMYARQKMEDLAKMKKQYEMNKVKNEYILMKIEDETNSAKTQMLPENEIEFSLKFRAKNHFNAIVLNEQIVVSDKKFNFLRLDN